MKIRIAPRQGAAAVVDQVNRIAARTDLSRAKRKLRPTADGYEAIWQEGLREFHPKAQRVSWTIREKSEIKQLAIRLHNADLAEDMASIIRLWADILHHKFGWMKDKPAAPTVGFFVRFYAQLQGAALELDHVGRVEAPRRLGNSVNRTPEPLNDNERAELDRLRAFLAEPSAPKPPTGFDDSPRYVSKAAADRIYDAVKGMSFTPPSNSELQKRKLTLSSKSTPNKTGLRDWDNE